MKKRKVTLERVPLERQTKLRLERALRYTWRRKEKKADKLYERLYMK